MKKLIVALVVIGAIVSGVVLLSNNDCKGSACSINSVTNPTPTELTLAQKVDKAVAGGGVFVDVRTIEEFNESHAKKAVLLPLADIEKGTYPAIAKDKTVYLYCRTGNRAGQAKTILEKAGFNNVINIGGLTDWQNQGGEVISS